MKPVLLTAAIAALVALAACNRAPDAAAVPDAATGNMVAAPDGPVSAAQAFDLRKERYGEMGDAMKAINRELKGGAPDVPRIQREPRTVSAAIAKAEVWSDPQGFAQAHEGYLRQTQSFRRVTDSGDVEQIRAAAQVLGKSCGTCHDKYRAPEQ